MSKYLNGFFLFFFLFVFIYGLSISSLNIDITIFLNLIMLCFSVFIFKDGFVISKGILCLFLFLLIDVSICIIVPILYNTYDFDILKTKINLLVSLFNVYSISFYLNKYYSKSYIYSILTVVLIVQSIIICLSLLNPDFGAFIGYISKSSSSVERMLSKYSGARGLGLTTFTAFGLSIILGLQLLVLCYSYVKNYISTHLFIVTLVLSTIASLSAGRTAFLGLLLGLITLAFTKKSSRNLILSVVGFTLSIMYLLTIDVKSIESPSLSVLYNYALEPILNYKSGQGLATTSTVGLQNMYFKLTNNQFFFGDGLYSGPDGTYYLGTDAGYMRFILFYGVFASVLLYSAFFLFCGTPCQVGGLLLFVDQYKNIDKSNLLTCDFICHGVPVPAIFNHYLQRVNRDYKKITSVSFRFLEGWGKQMTLFKQKGKGQIISVRNDFYMRMFDKSYIMDEACFSCKYSENTYQSDITIGDFWGIEKGKVYPHVLRKGVSLLIPNTSKAKSLIFKLVSEDKMTIIKETVEKVRLNNHNYTHNTKKPVNRDEFLKDFFHPDLSNRYLLRKYNLGPSFKNYKTVLRRYIY